MRILGLTLVLTLVLVTVAAGQAFVFVTTPMMRTFAAVLSEGGKPQHVIVLAGTAGYIASFTGGNTVEVCWDVVIAPVAQEVTTRCERKVPLGALRLEVVGSVAPQEPTP